MADLTTRKIDLWKEAMSPDPDASEVGARLATIPDTASAVVRFANSAFVGARSPVGTIAEAVVRIGCRTVGGLAMASMNRDLAERWGAPELWDVSLIVARAAKGIASVAGDSPVEAEHLFVAGLFSSTGAVALTRGDAGYLTWRHAQRARGADEATLLRREGMAYGVDHLEAAERCLVEWNLPDDISRAVASHHDPADHAGEVVRTAMAVVPDDGARCVDVRFGDALERLGLDRHESRILADAHLFAEVTRQAFEPTAVASRR